MFIAEDGAVIKNVILSKAQAEGIHCRGACTLQVNGISPSRLAFILIITITECMVGGCLRGRSDLQAGCWQDIVCHWRWCQGCLGQGKLTPTLGCI